MEFKIWVSGVVAERFHRVFSLITFYVVSKLNIFALKYNHINVFNCKR